MTNFPIFHRSFVGLGTLLFLAGCASANIGNAGYSATAADAGDLAVGAGSLKVVSVLPSPGSAAGGSQVVRVGDKVKVDVFGVDELDRDVSVDVNGRITLPLVGAVQASGQSIEALQTKVTQLYGARYLQNPEITLTVEQTVTVDGEFGRAGSFPVSGNTTLLRLVAAAGNFTDVGDPTNVFIYRTIGGQDYVAQYNVAEIREGKRADTPIYGGDVVVAFPSGMRVLGSSLSSALGLARNATGLASLVP